MSPSSLFGHRTRTADRGVAPAKNRESGSRNWVFFRILLVVFALFVAVHSVIFADNPPAPEHPSAHPAARIAVSSSAGDLLAPAAFRAALARVQPSLVTIQALADVAPGRTPGLSIPGEGPATGLIISPDGYIVSSTFNFIHDPRAITVHLADKSRHVARLLGRDETRKICLLKIDGVHDLPVPALAPPDKLRVGQWAISVGIGYGDTEPAISSGIVSALGRVGGRAVQTDANISPANYGGPLLDIDGRVIGICVPLNPLGQGVASGVEWYDSGIGFAIPLAGAERLLIALREPGKVIQPAWLGVQLQPTPDASPGAVVAGVQKASPAARAEIRAGDRITAADGETVQDVMQLRIMLGRHAAGDRIKLQVRRGGGTMVREVVLGPPPDRTSAGPPVRPR